MQTLTLIVICLLFIGSDWYFDGAQQAGRTALVSLCILLGIAVGDHLVKKYKNRTR